jgi:heterodisulfide reductase subunit B
MNIIYYPGCTLNTKAKNLGDLGVASAEKLGLNLKELEEWTCCQAAFPLASDNIMGLISPSRIIINAEKEGSVLTTLCSFCYNVLKRTNHVLKNDPVKRAKICEFLEEEYKGDIEVLHFLEVIKDSVGFDSLKKKVTMKLEDLSVVPYYGCQMLRPESVIKMDDAEKPQILDDFLRSLGCKVIDFPFKVECCGSYQIVNEDVKDAVLSCSHNILKSAVARGAQAIALSCPVCYFNLDKKQHEILSKYGDFKEIPVLYFTELLGLALEVDPKLFDFSKHAVDPRPLLIKLDFIKDNRMKIKEEAK